MRRTARASRLCGGTVITSPDSSRIWTYPLDGSGRSTCGSGDHAMSVMRTCASEVRVAVGHRQMVVTVGLSEIGCEL